jgi:hypothetical protein
MSRKRKNELDELLRDAVKFMEWPTGTGPTSARIELPDDFSIDELSMTSSSEDEANDDLKEELRREKRRKRHEFYVPDKPLSPDSPDKVEEPEDGYSKLKNLGNKGASTNINVPVSNKEATSKRLNLLSLVQETSFAKEASSSTATSATTSPKHFTVPMPGGVKTGSDNFNPQAKLSLQQFSIAGLFITPTVSPGGDHQHTPSPARHPLLSLTGRHVEAVVTPIIRGFLMGLPSRRY